MKTETKIILLILGVSLAFVALIVVSAGRSKPVDISLINSGKNARGPENSGNILVEFSDFFCPACKTAESYLTEIINKYPKDLKFVYRHFPLPQHPLAFKAAQAAEAAGIQGKFWEYKESLFANQENLNEGSFKEIAEELNLDLSKFMSDMDSDEVLKNVQSDLRTAKKLNLSGTPTFFLDGEKLQFNSFADLPKIIEQKLTKS